MGGSKWAPQAPDGTVGYHQGLIWPWYTQIWRIHPQMTFYPGNYAKPYDYREIFNYPWNGPRPSSAGAPRRSPPGLGEPTACERPPFPRRGNKPLSP